MTKQTTASERPNSFFTMVNPKTGEEFPCDPNRTWRITKDTFQSYYDANEIVFPGDYDFLHISKPVARYFKDKDMLKMGDNFGKIAVSTKLPDDIGMSQDGTKEIKDIFGCIPFPFPKSIKLIKYLIKTSVDKDSVILDFFSGSATAAHAVMQLNAEDGGNRRFIMVQLPEVCDEKSEAYKAGYKNICEIGKERIRRAGKKILEIKNNSQLNTIEGFVNVLNEKGFGGVCTELKIRDNSNELDTGFRVLKLDSSNMQDVYYNPSAMTQSLLDITIDNVKPDRTPMDLLFQVMLELGVELSAKIEEKEIQGKKYYIVNENDIIACFDDDLNNEVITEIAKLQPLYAVFKDKSFATDSVGINNEQIFKTYSPSTTIKVV